MTTEETADVARRYFAAWTGRRGADALRPLLADDFVFETAGHRVEGRETFLESASWPVEAATTMVAEAYDGDHGFQLYEAQHGTQRVRIAEHLVVTGGRIAASEIVVDANAFAAFMVGPAM